MAFTVWSRSSDTTLLNRNSLIYYNLKNVNVLNYSFLDFLIEPIIIVIITTRDAVNAQPTFIF